MSNIVNGDSANNNLVGTPGVDHLFGFEGNDILNGIGGADVLTGGPDNDTYIIDALDTLVELPNEGIDEVRANFSYTLQTNFENLRLTGNGSINGTGNAVANSIWGNSGNNVLDGAGGTDLLAGGHGNDIYITDGGDTLVESAAQGTDEVRSSVSHTLMNHFENLTLTGSAHINGTGNSSNNVIAGNEGNNVLNGGAGIDTFQMTRPNNNIGVADANLSTGVATGHGTDTLLNFENVRGTESNDFITGDAGNNTIDGAGGHDEIFVTGGVDSLQGGGGPDAIRFDNTGAANLNLANGAYSLSASSYGSVASIDHVVGSAFNDVLTGNTAVNHIWGGAGDDIITGGGGDDRVFGGAGSDRLVADSGSDYLLGSGDMIGGAVDPTSDTFEVRPGAANVTIADFTPGTDKIDLTAFGFNAAGISPNWTASASYQGSNTTLVLTPVSGQTVNISLQSVTSVSGLSLSDFVGAPASIVPATSPFPINGGNGIADIFVIDPLAILGGNTTAEFNIHGFEAGLDRIDLSAFGLLAPTYWDGWVYDYGNNDQTRMEFFGLNNEFLAVNLVGHNYHQLDYGFDFIL